MGTRHMLPETARLRRLARGSRDDARLRSEDGGSRNRRSKRRVDEFNPRAE